MNRIAVDLDEKLQSLDPARARTLEQLVRDAMTQVGQEAVTSVVTAEQKDALARLVGVWKTGNPPTDEDVDRMLEEERMAKNAGLARHECHSRLNAAATAVASRGGCNLAGRVTGPGNVCCHREFINECVLRWSPHSRN